MIYLISTIPGGYAEREFGGIKYCLDRVDDALCHIVNDETFGYTLGWRGIQEGDFYIVADYYYNPTFKPEAISSEMHAMIQRLPKERTAIYYSDPLFKFEDPSKFSNWKYFVFFSVANYRKTEKEEYKDCRIWENVNIEEKEVLDLPISEMAFWSYIKMQNGRTDFEEANKDYDISYIINSKILSRMGMLRDVRFLKCQFGNFPKIDNIDIQDFVNRSSGCKWETQKAFGLDYLKLQNGKFTLCCDDDIPIKVAWPMRFYEAMAVGIVPLIKETKDPSHRIYSYQRPLGICYYKGEPSLREKLRFFETRKEYTKVVRDCKKFMDEFVYDAKRLYNKTISEVEKVVGKDFYLR